MFLFFLLIVWLQVFFVFSFSVFQNELFEKIYQTLDREYEPLRSNISNIALGHSAVCPVVISLGKRLNCEQTKCLIYNQDPSCTGCVTPPGTFFQLKMFMLMCLLLLHSSDSSEDTKQVHSRNLHLLVIADDLLRVQRLLLYGASFAERMLVYSPISELFPSFSRDPFGSDTCMVNG